MTLTRKGARAAAVAATAKYILQYDPEIIARGEIEKEDDENLESKKREKAITEWIGRPLKLPSRNKEEEDEDE